MANATRYSGTLPSVGGEHTIQRIVTQAEYDIIAAVSSSVLGNVVPGDTNYDSEFDNTLWFIREN